MAWLTLTKGVLRPEEQHLPEVFRPSEAEPAVAAAAAAAAGKQELQVQRVPEPELLLLAEPAPTTGPEQMKDCLQNHLRI